MYSGESIDQGGRRRCMCGAGQERYRSPSPPKINRSTKPKKKDDSLFDEFGSMIGGSLADGSLDSTISNNQSCNCRGNRHNRIRHSTNKSVNLRNLSVDKGPNISIKPIKVAEMTPTSQRSKLSSPLS